MYIQSSAVKGSGLSDFRRMGHLHCWDILITYQGGRTKDLQTRLISFKGKLHMTWDLAYMNVSGTVFSGARQWMSFPLKYQATWKNFRLNSCWVNPHLALDYSYPWETDYGYRVHHEQISTFLRTPDSVGPNSDVTPRRHEYDYSLFFISIKKVFEILDAWRRWY